MSKKTDELTGQLLETVVALRKKYGDNIILKGSDITTDDFKRVSTGSLSLDIETGGGFPYGRIVELWGRESSGKTTLALKVVANVQKMGKVAAWIDVEGAYDPQWAKILGVDIEKILVCRPQAGDDAAEILEAFVRTGEVGVVVIDSLAVLTPGEELEKSIVDDKQRVGGRATLIQRMTRRLVAALNTYDEEKGWNQCLILCLNQVTEKIGITWGSPDVAPGGRAIPHAAAIRVKLLHGSWVEVPNTIGEKDKIGHVIKFHIIKNKTAPPGRASEFTLYTAGSRKGEIDNTESLIRYGQLYDLVQLSGRTYTYGDLKAVGKDKFIALLQAEANLAERLKKDILKVAVKL